MKQYTTRDQTIKLIELGFEKPKGSHSYWRGNELVINNNYSIGELVEILPEFIDKHYYTFNISIDNDRSPSRWLIEYFEPYRFRNTELIDALFDMLVLLKEGGVI